MSYGGYTILEEACSKPHLQNKLIVDVDDKVGEPSRWKYVVLIKSEDVASKKVRLQIF